jgi:hypothetical protein
VNPDHVVKRRIFGNLCKAKDGIEGFQVEVMKSDLMAVLHKRLHRCLCNGVIEASRTGVSEDYRDSHYVAFLFHSYGQLGSSIGLPVFGSIGQSSENMLEDLSIIITPTLIGPASAFSLVRENVFKGL